MWRGSVGVEQSGQLAVSTQISLILLGNSLSSNTSSNTMEDGTRGSDSRRRATERSRLDEALDHFDTALADLIDTVDTGGLDHLSAEEKVAVWQRFETLRNRLPIIDHRLIADAEAQHLSEEYCSSSINQFLIRVLHLSPGEAATRSEPPPRSVRGPRCSARNWNLCCPNWPRCNARAWCRRRKCRSWNGPCTNSAATDLDPEAVETAEQLLTDHAAILAPPELRRFAPRRQCCRPRRAATRR